MRKLLSAFVIATVVGFSSLPAAFAQHEEEAFDPVHHTADGYYLDFEPLGKVELPRLFLVRDGNGSLGLDVFGSTTAALRSGHYRADDDDAHGGEEHGEADHATPQETPSSEVPHAEALLASGAHLDAHLERNPGQILIDFSITRHLVFAVLASLIVLLLFTQMAGRYKRGIGRETAPRGLLQNLLETLVLFIRDDVAKPSMGADYKRFLPFLLTVFFFILTCNLFGLVPFGATATSNLMVTAVLATFTFLLTQFNGSKDHWRHVFWPPGMPVPIKIILIPVEIMGLFTKPVALAIRLFANMTAGHLVILSLIGLIFSFGDLFGTAAGYGVSPLSLGFALFVSLLEILIAFIQAYIFTILSALFIGMAMAEHEHHTPHEDAHQPAPAEATLAAPLILGDGVEEATVAAPVPA